MDTEDAIAIVGIGCKFPGAENVDEFWNVLKNGEDHVKDIPKERFNVEAFYDTDPDTPGKTYIRKAGLVTGINEWDYKFFGIGENEAKRMDPQQRLVLECTYKALEDGGITKISLNQSDTGVYIGVMNGEFEAITGIDPNLLTNTSVTGISRSIISAQVAYFLNLHGPAMSIDTACSSSLVAIHTAEQAIKTGEMKMAICGGVNVLLSPSTSIGLSKARMASKTGKCHTFSQNADGYVRGEGCGIVILKRLGDAIRDNNKVWATIATACNQDGHENSPITAPAGVQQVKLLERIFEKLAVHPSSIQYIEAHVGVGTDNIPHCSMALNAKCTGTPVGDPIEVNALGNFFSSHRNNHNIKIGSVKTNIGHLESAAGVAGLIKVLLMMKHGEFVPSLHAEPPNKNIPFQKYGLVVSQDNTEWKYDTQGRRLASVNSFGFGGTNSHAVVCSTPNLFSLPNKHKVTMTDVLFPNYKVVVLSAITNKSVQDLTEDLRQNLNGMKLEDLSYTSVLRRDHFKYRRMFVTDSIGNLDSQLKTFLHKSDQSISVTHFQQSKVVFVFCGVGTTWKGMCADFITMNSVFRKQVLGIDMYLKNLNANISMYETIKNKDEVYEDPMKAHLAIFTIQVALAASWRHIGIQPTAIVGQSVGEVAAAYECGSLSLEDAVTVIYNRSLALSACKTGSMMVIRNCSTEDVSQACAEILSNFKCKANIAVYNSNESCTVSGDTEALKKIKTRLKDEAVFIPLKTSCAYHSHHAKEASERLFDMLKTIRPKQPHVRFFSTVTGMEMKNEFASPTYWALNVLKPVKFEQAMKLVKDEVENVIFLEIGPRPVFMAHQSTVFPNTNIVVLPSINKSLDTKTFFSSLNTLFEKGINPLWEHLTEVNGSLSKFPRYILSKHDCCFESEMVNRWTQENILEGNVGRMIRAVPGTNREFKILISKSNTPFVYEHVVENKILIPGALYGEAALEIGRILLTGYIENLEVSWKIWKPLEITMNEERSLLIETDFVSPRKVDFRVRESPGSRILADGSAEHIEREDSTTFDVSGFEMTLGKQQPNIDIYKILNTLGFKHGPTFRIVSDFRTSMNDSLSEINLSKYVQTELPRTCFHPVIIDGMFQTSFNPNMLSGVSKGWRILPTGVKMFRVKQAPVEKMTCFSRFMLNQNSKLLFNTLLLRENGIVVAEMESFEMKIISEDGDFQKYFLEEAWQNTILPVSDNSYSIPSLIFSWQHEVLEEARKILCRTCSNLETVDLSHKGEREAFLSLLKERRHFHLYFIPGFVNADGYLNGNDVLETVTKSSHLLLKVLQEIDSKNTSLYIITEWTQGGEERDVFGVFGSELWGMGRSFQKECPDFKLNMIDLHGQLSDLQDLFLSIINALNKDKENLLPREYIITSNGVLTKQLQNMPALSFESFVKKIDSNREKNFSVRARSARDNETLFKVPNLEKSTCAKENCTVLIHEVLLCSKNHLFPPPKTIPIGKYWSSSYDTGLDVMACEFTGHFMKNGTHAVGCCLVNVTSIVEVNKLCTCELSDLPFYRIGMFSNTVIAMCLAEKIGRKSNVQILFDKQYENVTKLIQMMLRKKHCSVFAAEFNAKKDTQNPLTTCLVLLTNQIVCSFEAIVFWFPNMKQLLSIKGLLPLSTTLNNQAKYPFIESCAVDMYEVFEQTKMQKRFLLAKRLMLDNKDFFSQITAPSSECILNLHSWNSTTEVEVPNKFLIRPDSAYIVIGGLSGLGWEVTKFLAARGAKVVITLSRRTPSSLERNRLENMKNIRNTLMIHEKVDITEIKDLERVFSGLLRHLGNTRIRGVFQGAGVLKDLPVTRLTNESFDIPLIPKILGTWNLHLMTKDIDLDYFVMHSSIASLFGNNGQTNYAAANAFMDAFAYYRRSKGKAAQVINWGLLSIGMGADQDIQSINAMGGLHALPKEKIIVALNHALITNRVQFAFASIDISRVERKEEKLRKERQNRLKIDIHSKNTGSNESFQNKHQLLQSWIDSIRYASASVLAVEPTDIKETSILLDFGLDSQKAIELINYLYASSHVRLPVVYLMAGKSAVSDIAEHFMLKITEDDTTDNDNFVSESISFLEQHYLDLRKKDTDNPHLTIKLDLRVSLQLKSADIWKGSLLNLISINPEFRTLLQETEQGKKRANIQKVIIDIEDVTFHFITVSSKEDFEKASDSISKFDPFVDIPLKAVFWKSPTFGIIRLLINHCCFDNGCVIAIVKDLSYILNQYIFHQYAPDTFPHQPVDPALAMERMLNEQMEELKTYWNMELSKCRESQSFKRIKKVEEISSGRTSEVIARHLNVDQLQKMEEMSTKSQRK
ncbi:mycolipanoate synthase-like [Saccostrea cucullata]|uniref:mycolipanoate synthase-like n=1 Tax=Saccostrea cuccullata TaxID=36930 RepID=UPI002ED3629F